MTTDDHIIEPWWGISHPLTSGSGKRWKIGPLTLYVAYDSGVLVMARTSSGDPLEIANEIADVTLEDIPAPDNDHVTMRSMGGNDEAVELRAALADRGVVIRPEFPTQIARRSEAAFYMSTPIWVQVVQSDKVLWDVPTSRPSDTWFGSPIGDGEFAYAGRTLASPSRDRLAIRASRVTTEVTIQNASDENISVERFNLPAPSLSIFQTEDGRLWTESVKVIMRSDSTRSNVELSDKVAVDVASTRKIASARKHGLSALEKAIHRFVG